MKYYYVVCNKDFVRWQFKDQPEEAEKKRLECDTEHPERAPHKVKVAEGDD